jgi:hypothetical protein
MKCRVTWSEGVGQNMVEYIQGYESRTAQAVQQIPVQFLRDLGSTNDPRVVRVELLEY